jgi:hypothetical protein
MQWRRQVLGLGGLPPFSSSHLLFFFLFSSSFPLSPPSPSPLPPMELLDSRGLQPPAPPGSTPAGVHAYRKIRYSKNNIVAAGLNAPDVIMYIALHYIYILYCVYSIYCIAHMKSSRTNHHQEPPCLQLIKIIRRSTLGGHQGEERYGALFIYSCASPWSLVNHGGFLIQHARHPDDDYEDGDDTCS